MTTQTAPARGSSFYAAMRILPEAQRTAIFSVYGFCRAVDDIVDEEGTQAEKFAALQAWRADLGAIFDGSPPEHLRDLDHVIRSFRLKQEDFQAVIDGMAMDAEGDIRAPDWQTLDLYCDRVASAVGRLCVPIFGLGPDIGLPLAYHLGRALQLTNILRDIDEDAAIGRLYLPSEALTAAQITSCDPDVVRVDSRLPEVCRAVADRAREHFDSARSVMKHARRSAVRAPRLMEIAYRSILEKMVSAGFAMPRARFKPSRIRMVAAYLRHGLI